MSETYPTAEAAVRAAVQHAADHDLGLVVIRACNCNAVSPSSAEMESCDRCDVIVASNGRQS